MSVVKTRCVGSGRATSKELAPSPAPQPANANSTTVNGQRTTALHPRVRPGRSPGHWRPHSHQQTPGRTARSAGEAVKHQSGRARTAAGADAATTGTPVASTGGALAAAELGRAGAPEKPLPAGCGGFGMMVFAGRSAAQGTPATASEARTSELWQSTSAAARARPICASRAALARRVQSRSSTPAPSAMPKPMAETAPDAETMQGLEEKTFGAVIPGVVVRRWLIVRSPGSPMKLMVGDAMAAAAAPASEPDREPELDD